MVKENLLGACVFVGFLALVALPTAAADMGVVPPGNVSVYEPGQKAIIAWNGEEEVLILSTDVRGSESSWAVELLPLPSCPEEPKAGRFDSFVGIQNLLNDQMRLKYRGEGYAMRPRKS